MVPTVNRRLGGTARRHVLKDGVDSSLQDESRSAEWQLQLPNAMEI
jgi:hypothetical protein